jgi:hypothetical protein
MLDGHCSVQCELPFCAIDGSAGIGLICKWIPEFLRFPKERSELSAMQNW